MHQPQQDGGPRARATWLNWPARHCTASRTSELGKAALCIRISKLEPVHYTEKMNNERNKGSAPLPCPFLPGCLGRTRWLRTLNHWKRWTNVQVLPTHPVAVPIQTTVTKERFCWGCRIREIKIFIGKAGRDKGTHGNYRHYHNDKHKQPVPSVLQISASAILPRTHTHTHTHVRAGGMCSMWQCLQKIRSWGTWATTAPVIYPLMGHFSPGNWSNT